VAPIDIRYSARRLIDVGIVKVDMSVRLRLLVVSPSRLIVAAAAAVWLVCGAAPVRAGFFSPPQGTWCAFQATGLNDCSFFSQQQCRATLSGIGGVCSPNLQAPQANNPPRSRSSRRRQPPQPTYYW
jgi:Protein of unknown function (DUF3551)